MYHLTFLFYSITLLITILQSGHLQISLNTPSSLIPYIVLIKFLCSQSNSIALLKSLFILHI